MIIQMKRYINFKNSLKIILSMVVAALWFYMHVYRLGEVPRGIHIDEAASAYDAFCLLNWGTDRFLKPYPLYFYGISGGQSAAYIYLCAICIKFFGMNTVAFRIPLCVFSAITLIFSSLIVKKCYGVKWAYLNAFLFCLLPYFTMQSRFGLDCNLMLGATTFCVWLTIAAFEKNKKPLYILLGISWGLAFYTYVLSYIIYTVFFIMLFLWICFRKICKRGILEKDSSGFNISALCAVFLPLIIIVIPLIIMVIINVFDLETLTTDFFTIYRVKRSASELSMKSMPENLLHAIKLMFTCDTDMWQDAYYGYFTMYLFSIPLCVFGVFYSVIKLFLKSHNDEKNLSKDIVIIMIFFLTACLFTAALRNEHKIYQMNAVYFALLFFLTTGIRAIYFIFLHLFKKVFAANTIVALIIMVYALKFYDFQNFYFNVYSVGAWYLFTEQLDDVIGAFDKQIQEHKTYIDAYYLHYMIIKQADPNLIHFTYPGINQYKNITFASAYTVFPEDINSYDIYVINNSDYDRIDMISEYPFERRDMKGYVVFYKK